MGGFLGLRLGLMRFQVNGNSFFPIPGEGNLYNEKVLKNGKTIAPPGWRVMTTDDYVGLVDYLGGTETANPKLKSTDNWEDSGTNDSGFTAEPVGIRTDTGTFTGRNKVTNFWIDNK